MVAESGSRRGEASLVLRSTQYATIDVILDMVFQRSKSDRAPLPLPEDRVSIERSLKTSLRSQEMRSCALTGNLIAIQQPPILKLFPYLSQRTVAPPWNRSPLRPALAGGIRKIYMSRSTNARRFW